MVDVKRAERHEPARRDRRAVLLGIALLAVLLVLLLSCEVTDRRTPGGSGSGGSGSGTGGSSSAGSGSVNGGCGPGSGGSGSGSGTQGTVGSSGEAELDDSTFTITGDTTEALSPGVMRQIDLTMINPHGESLTVRRIAIAVGTVTAPRATRLQDCSAADFVVEQPGPDLQAMVPAATSISLSGLGVRQDWWPRVGMLNRSVNQDGCKGAVVTLVYSGSGTLHSS